MAEKSSILTKIDEIDEIDDFYESQNAARSHIMTDEVESNEIINDESDPGAQNAGEMLTGVDAENRGKIIEMSIMFALIPCLKLVESVYSCVVEADKPDETLHMTFADPNRKQIARVCLDIVPCDFKPDFAWFLALKDGDNIIGGQISLLKKYAQLCFQIVREMHRNYSMEFLTPECRLIFDDNFTFYIVNHKDHPVRIGYKVIIDHMDDDKFDELLENLKEEKII